MKKVQRILAMTAIVLIAILIILTLVFALLTYFEVGDFNNAWKACAWSMVIAPIFFYAILVVYRMFNRNK